MTSLGILSWKAHATLRKTLASYAPLAPLVDERVVFFNEISDADRALAAEFGFEARGSAENLGIFDGTRAMLESLIGDIVISCQNDNPVCASPDVLAERLSAAREAVASGRVSWVRMRNRFEPGFSSRGKFTKYWGPGLACGLRRLLRPGKARRMIGRAVSALDDPSVRFPTAFRRGPDGLFYSTSAWIDYTDQPFLASHAFIREVLDWANDNREGKRTLNGRAVPEIILNSTDWWRNGAFSVAVSDGVFAHARFDDSFRSGNAAYNPNLAD